MIPSVKSCTHRKQIQYKILCKSTFMSNSKTFTAYTKEKLPGFLRNNLPDLCLPRWTGLAELRESLCVCAWWMVSGLYICSQPIVHWMFRSFKRLLWSGGEESCLLALRGKAELFKQNKGQEEDMVSVWVWATGRKKVHTIKETLVGKVKI